MTDFRALLETLTSSEVEFVVVGGAAGAAHGSTRLTLALDIVYQRGRENLTRLAKALEPHSPYLRGSPPGRPFTWDAVTLAHGMNFTLTKSGWIPSDCVAGYSPCAD